MSFTSVPLLSPRHPSILAETDFLPQALLAQGLSSQWVALHYYPACGDNDVEEDGDGLSNFPTKP